MAGICSKEADAKAVHDEIRKAIPGVYVRKVTRYLPGVIPVCPKVQKTIASRERTKAPAGFEEAPEEATADRAKGLKWRIYVAPAECGKNVAVQLIGKRGELLSERVEAAHCVKGDPKIDGSGESKVWSAVTVELAKGEKSFVLLTYESWASDTGCNGGDALCPTPTGIVTQELPGGECTSTPYSMKEGETYCQ